jgi:hypothetical protein
VRLHLSIYLSIYIYIYIYIWPSAFTRKRACAQELLNICMRAHTHTRLRLFGVRVPVGGRGTSQPAPLVSSQPAPSSYIHKRCYTTICERFMCASISIGWRLSACSYIKRVSCIVRLLVLRPIRVRARFLELRLQGSFRRWAGPTCTRTPNKHGGCVGVWACGRVGVCVWACGRVCVCA